MFDKYSKMIQMECKTFKRGVFYEIQCATSTSIAPICVKRSSCRHIWLLTGGYTHTHTHWKHNTPILLHKPDLSEKHLLLSTGGFLLSSPPLPAAHLFLPAAAFPSIFSSTLQSSHGSFSSLKCAPSWINHTLIKLTPGLNIQSLCWHIRKQHECRHAQTSTVLFQQ